ncbi:hypothetical protein M011DRAFT_478978 [Sporormia fimetaria CBS 119925]|uniref:Mitochondrial zinc maintenance protein 1, mitochondrial n=1 Tax=Sporormia fimetaria CBS 119925 TaxID=1340428 RepID=A0A6A6V6F7_9PLEO|nr:hypothetical protein M011DRAFT_478978 [Sporormia fimetaria CBS 119925]
MALNAYRHLLRSTRIAFQGDIPTLTAARYRAREAFEANRALAPGSEELTKQITHAEEVAKFVRENLVQGVATGDDSFKLRIHEHTERGDNEDIKKAKGTTLGGTRTKCCSA